MSGPLPDAAAVAGGYLMGSVPFGLILARAAGGLDVREVGSGSIGSTNVLRAAGPVAAGATFALDIGKGATAVAVARLLGGGPPVQVAAGLAAAVGHSWPVFAGFRGGKSVVTACGSLAVLAPGIAACAVAGGLGTLAATRVVSLASLASAGTATAVAAGVAARGGAQAPLAFALLATGLITVRHAGNIQRLARGVEPRVSLRRG